MFGDVDELKYGPHLKTVRLKRRSGESFGFALRGGREHKIGFFVTQVQPGSESERQGLSVRVFNFFPIKLIFNEKKKKGVPSASCDLSSLIFWALVSVRRS
jgi:hypothetical protein